MVSGWGSKPKKDYIPAPGLEPGPVMDKVLSLACLPIPSYRL